MPRGLLEHIPALDVELPGDIGIPDPARGVVIFAHGSGSSRRSPRNRFVAKELQDAGLATVLVDLLTTEEERAAEARFDISLLARRLIDVIDWVTGYDSLAGHKVGLFGASTGAAAALVAAAERRGTVRAVVSRGGRPDLAGASLRSVLAPTLLIVGGRDEIVLNLNRAAMDTIAAEQRLEVVPGATHLFAEPGALELVARLATSWFTRHLRED